LNRYRAAAFGHVQKERGCWPAKSPRPRI
jgi:hypothetical protein